MSIPLRMVIAAATMMLTATSARADADEASVVLKEAPGRDAVYASCLACHSPDYIVMNAPFLDEKGWRASVSKMINVMGAPITAEQADEIVRYLAANYGATMTR